MQCFNNLFINKYLWVRFYGLIISYFYITIVSYGQKDSIELDNLVILGSRSGQRVAFENPVAVDIFNIPKIRKYVAQADLGGLLHYSSPSFTATPQTSADGTDHIDPAALRGLSPDQTLVLLNGKRRHTSALINTLETFGRGSTGTDLNAIPALAVSNIEILRDGAAAQYGSDAVAGVINISLKNDIGTQLSFQSGVNITRFESYTEATKGDIQKDIPTIYHKETAIDGQHYQFGLYHGLPLGKKGGNLGLTLALIYRGPTSRAGEATGSITKTTDLNTATTPTLENDEKFLAQQGISRKDIRGRTGQSEFLSGQFFFNGNIPIQIDKKSVFYFFGGLSYRAGNSAALYRKPGLARVIYGVTPHGFLPIINTGILDGSTALGFRTEKNGWHIDLSNTIGTNIINFNTSQSQNSSSGNLVNINAAGSLIIDSTQRDFYAGALAFLQNTAYLDIHHSFPVLHKLNLAFGTTYRYESYLQKAGEIASYANFNRRSSLEPGSLVDINGNYVINNLPAIHSNPLLEARAYSVGGAQGFPGISQESNLTVSRHNLGIYVDAEQYFNKNILLNIAGRYEYYTDFGSNISGKIATRFTLIPGLNLRASFSNGFKAPSLQQRYLFQTVTVISAGTATQRVTFQNESPAAKALGINSLQPEISLQATTGIAFNKNNFSLSLDAYYIHINNRIIYTGSFGSSSTIKNILDRFDVQAASFFTNGIDTRTVGIDLVSNYKIPLPTAHKLSFSLLANYNKSQQVGGFHISNTLKNESTQFFSPNSYAYMFEVTPRYKGFFIAIYSYKKWQFYLREGIFGHVFFVDDNDNSFWHKKNGISNSTDALGYVYRQKLNTPAVTDISVSYNIKSNLRLSLGVNNLFDAYTDKVNIAKGAFHKIRLLENKTGYTVEKQGISAKELGWHNNDQLTAGFNIGNQYNYSRRISVIGVNGRYTYLRLTFTL